MDKEELIKWMKDHGVVETLRCYVMNDLQGNQNYESLKSLATTGTVTIQLGINSLGQVTITTIPTVIEPPKTVEEPKPAPESIQTPEIVPSTEEISLARRPRRRTE